MTEPLPVECVCGCELQMLVIRRRPRFFRRDAAGTERNVTACPVCGSKLEGLSAEQVRLQQVRVP